MEKTFGLVLDYDEFIVVRWGDRYFYISEDEGEMYEVELVHTVDLVAEDMLDATIGDLLNIFPDVCVTGEHLHSADYMYFKEKEIKNEENN